MAGDEILARLEKALAVPSPQVSTLLRWENSEASSEVVTDLGADRETPTN